MKKKFIATLLLISIISLTACNNTEPVTESTIESSVETEESIAESLSATEATETTTPSETTTESQTEEIYLQEDGIYYVSDELCQKFREYSLFSDWTDEEYAEELQIFLETFYPIDQTPEALLARAAQISKDLEENEIQEDWTGNEEFNPETDTTIDNSEAKQVIVKDEKGYICTSEMVTEIKAALKEAGLGDEWAINIMQGYYEATNGNSTSVDKEILKNTANSLAEAVETQNKIQQEQLEQAQQQQQEQQQAQQNQNNTQGNAENNNNNSSSAPSDWQTPETNTPSNNNGPGPGEFTIDLEASDAAAGDGGELITDGKLNAN